MGSGRDEQWLQQMLAAGFSVHHLDGDHGNDAPGNLVLIESVDHMRLQGMEMLGKVARKGSEGPAQTAAKDA